MPNKRKRHPLTWGDLLVASLSGAMSVGLDHPVQKKHLFKDIEDILAVTGRANDPVCVGEGGPDA